MSATIISVPLSPRGRRALVEAHDRLNMPESEVLAGLLTWFSKLELAEQEELLRSNGAALPPDLLPVVQEVFPHRRGNIHEAQ
jgi:hypothetical protein